ncbi:uncharacterized protein LOC115627565 [Scaptodrosophila lebanonensis]|uniref:Uncharacterized protein LOC115627565 n=1 Tax=Drosophila lebanonensis TaxID=7225 RepID=A0A6J2TVG8_DROLE|nr:uncharacterized protein LOC115627565 [Scaptodrosophila lebanonensis]
MCKLSFCFLALFACVLAGASAGVSQPRAPTEQRNILVVKDLREFAAKHPGLKMERLVKAPAKGRAGTQTVRYVLGTRVSGDRLVAQGADVYAYPARKDVSLQLTYPEAGVGAIVTYVEVICTQDSSDGNAFVVAGGIGQRFISIVLEASQTENFSYQAQYYGSD